MRLLTAVAVGLLATACANTAKKLNHVSVGMNKAQVMEVLGEPDETRAHEGIEYMMYELRKAPGKAAQTGCGVAGVYTLGLAYLFKDCQFSDDDYFVQLKQGAVTAYGRVGDFGSTAPAQATLNINQRIEAVPAPETSAPAPELAQ